MNGLYDTFLKPVSVMCPQSTYIGMQSFNIIGSVVFEKTRWKKSYGLSEYYQELHIPSATRMG